MNKKKHVAVSGLQARRNVYGQYISFGDHGVVFTYLGSLVTNENDVRNRKTICCKKVYFV